MYKVAFFAFHRQENSAVIVATSLNLHRWELGDLLRMVEAELGIRTHNLHHIEPGVLVRTHCRIGVVVVGRIWVGARVDSLHNLHRMRDIVLKLIKLF